jgi:hypothetical protein
VSNSGGSLLPDAWYHLKGSESRDFITGIVAPSKDTEGAFNVCPLKEFDPAPFFKRNIAICKFYLEGSTVIRRAKKYGLIV